ncbi:MAG: ATP synthase F1 subunit gamma [Eubacteriales bacterium]|nr:ATP synthase F1 subunit gamma [Eubacteriales bacterium]MDD4390371.1 ATP synthase F1 subunit gamma [Eubacteriales bacterium]
MASNNMQDIKRRIKSINSTEHITSAMRLVSAAKLRKAKTTFDKTTEYFHFITGSMEEIFSNTKEVPDRYIEGNREIKKTCYIIISSNKGLCGSFNANVIKETEHNLVNDAKEEAVFVAIGSKGRDYFKKREREIIGSYMEPPEIITFKDVVEISAPILKQYEDGEIDRIVLIYTSFVNNLEQKPKTVQLLPFRSEQFAAAGDIQSEEMPKMANQVEYEPSIEDVFGYLVPKYVEIVLFGAVIESATCEHAARRIAMENATDNAREMLDKLSLFYNRARQASITNEIIEVVSGTQAQN